MSGFSLQFNPCPRVPPALDDGILNGDTKATLVAWGDDITFLDRDEDDAAAASRGDSRERRNAPSFCNPPLCSLSLSLFGGGGNLRYQSGGDKQLAKQLLLHRLTQDARVHA